jgi:hypothetical protein
LVEDRPSKAKNKRYTAEKSAVENSSESEWSMERTLAWGVRVQGAPNKIGAIGPRRRILAKICLGVGGIFPKFGASIHRRDLACRLSRRSHTIKFHPKK